MMIYSIGYEKITIDYLIRIMDEKRIDRTIDVRSIPYSRMPDKYEFNRNRMIITMGDSYLWKGDILGGKHGPSSEEGLCWMLNLPDWVRFILMCVEADPRKCHRYYDISKRLLHTGIDIVHLYGIEEILTSELVKEETYVR